MVPEATYHRELQPRERENRLLYTQKSDTLVRGSKTPSFSRFTYQVVNDIVQEQDEAVVRHPDSLIYQSSTQQGLGLTDNKTKGGLYW